MAQPLSKAGAIDPPHCDVCWIPYRAVRCVMEFLAQRYFVRKGPPQSSVWQNTWFCPACGNVESDRGTTVRVESGTALQYEPPRCLRKEARHPVLMRKVKRAKHFGLSFDEYKCALCDRRARVLVRDRSVPFIIERGRVAEFEFVRQGNFYHTQPFVNHPLTQRNCEARPVLWRALCMLYGDHILLSICSGCLSVSYVPKAWPSLEAWVRRRDATRSKSAEL